MTLSALERGQLAPEHQPHHSCERHNVELVAPALTATPAAAAF
jgi:hypothetical protein